jgi:hypothetical protein
MRIKNWGEFSESISGWELVGKDMGPNYPQSQLPNSLSTKDTNILIGIDGNFYTESDYEDLFLTLSKKYKLDPNLRQFSRDNLNLLLKDYK